MSGHDHAHGSQHLGGVHRWRLLVALGLVVGFMLVEFVAAALSGSLALLTDAGHMLADSITLTTATVATIVASRSRRTAHATYGAYRAEVFASGFAALVMIAVAIFVVTSALSGHATHEVETTPMLVVGIIGLAVNIVTMLILRPGSESLNVKGAYLEVMADALGSVGVIAAAILVKVTGAAWWDIAIALAIGAFVLVRAVILGREVLHVLAQHTPHGIDTGSLEARLCGLPGVTSIHDLHVWALTSGMNVMSVHVLISDDADPQATLQATQALVGSEFGLDHATIQVESRASESCEHITW